MWVSQSVITRKSGRVYSRYCIDITGSLPSDILTLEKSIDNSSRSCKLKGSVNWTSLQIDMQNFVSTKSDLLATKKNDKKVIFAET